MYRIYAVNSDNLLPNGVAISGNTAISYGSILIHDDSIPGFDKKVADPKLTIQQSSSGTFTFSCTKDNPGYDYIQRLSTTIIIYEDNQELWRGRVIQEEEDFYFNRKFTCEGELGYLNDTLQPPHAYPKTISPKELLSSLLDVHNSKVGEDRQITVGYVSAKLSFKDEIELVENDNPSTSTSDKYLKYDGYYVSNATYYSYYLIFANVSSPNSEPRFGEEPNDTYVKVWYQVDNKRKEQPKSKEIYGYNPKYIPNEPAGWISGITNLANEDPPIYILNPNYVDETQQDDPKNYFYTNYETTMSCLSSMLINKIGGYVVTRRQDGVCYLDYFADDEYDNFRSIDDNFGEVQRVRFGENLLDFVKKWDMSDFATVLLPLGAEIKHPDDWPGDADHPRGLTDYTTAESVKASYIQASGTYVKGTTYYRRLSGYKKANTSNFVVGQTDVSNLYTYETTIVPMGINYYGVYDSQTTYYYNEDVYDEDGNLLWELNVIPKEFVEKEPPTGPVYDYDDFIIRETLMGRTWLKDLPWKSGETIIGNPTPLPDPTYPSRDHIYTLNPNYPSTTNEYKKCSSGSKYDDSKTYYEEYIYYEAVNTNGWTEGETDVSLFYAKERSSTPYVIAQTPMETYGWIEKAIIWDDIADPLDLYNKAVKYLSDYQFDKLSFVVTALDLNFLGVPNTVKFRLLDKVLVESPIHGINRYFPITKISIPLDSPENTEYTFGDVVDDTLTGSIS